MILQKEYEHIISIKNGEVWGMIDRINMLYLYNFLNNFLIPLVHLII